MASDPDAHAGPVANGVALIEAERRRQIASERWSSQHDDSHKQGELARAAACYATPKENRPMRSPRSRIPALWPWLGLWWKPMPDDRIRELVKAGALIAAEIDRLQRKENDRE